MEQPESEEAVVGPKPTHYGWLLFCPVTVAMIGDFGAALEPRWAFLRPVLWLALQCNMALITLMSLINPDYEPTWSIKITGEINAQDKEPG